MAVEAFAAAGETVEAFESVEAVVASEGSRAGLLVLVPWRCTDLQTSRVEEE